MSRRVVITGIGPVSGLGLDIESNWDALCDGRSAIGPIQAFDPAGFESQIAAEVPEFKISQYVPKTYRKATKVMARDIQLAVVAADAAARDAGLTTNGTVAPDDPDATRSYGPGRMGAHIGAGLIAAELDELTGAFVKARDEQGNFDMHQWGSDGITHLTPLWLLKYLPNMLACHVTIIHDAQGPSNTITCAESSGALSVGESLRVIQRNAADLCFCGGAESKLNPMGWLRQQFTGRLNAQSNDAPADAVRPFDQNANGMIVGEGGAIVTLEALDTAIQRAPHHTPQNASHAAPHIYAEVTGFGASQSVHPESRNALPEPNGTGITLAIRKAMQEAQITPDDIDLIVPFGIGVRDSDTAEATGMVNALGTRLHEIPIASIKPMVGNCLAGAAALDIAIAAKAIYEQRIPATLNCDTPLSGLNCQTAPSRELSIRHALVIATGSGGQNAALILRRYQP